MSENLSHLSKRWSDRAASKEDKRVLFQELVERSRQHRLNGTDLKELKDRSFIGTAPLLGSASFYDYLRPEEAQIKVRICDGTCCEMHGTQKQLREDLLSKFDPSQIGKVKCLGRCYENSSFQYNDSNYSGKVELNKLIDHKSGFVPGAIPVQKVLSEPLLTGPAIGLGEFGDRLKKILSVADAKLLDAVKLSGLRGRGGAGFPFARKLEACRNESAPEKYLVCNADEGDPGAFSDRYLLECQPYLVLLGMAIAAQIIGASTAILYIRAEYPEAFRIIEDAISAIESAGICPELDFVAVRGAGSYVCGEETALLSSLEGQRPEVRVRPPYPVSAGLFLMPTVVSNVETLACLPTIIEGGGDAFAKLGTAKTSGTKLVCLDWAFNRPGVVEVAMGTPLKEIIYDIGAGLKVPLKAIQLGGPLGGIVPMSMIGDLTLDFESLHDHGFLLGHASIVSIPESVAMVEYLRHLFHFVATESCGKCYPCRIGSIRGSELLDRAINQKCTIDKSLFGDLLETLEIGSLCALGGGLPLPIRNALHYFGQELQPYFSPEPVSVGGHS